MIWSARRPAQIAILSQSQQPSAPKSPMSRYGRARKVHANTVEGRRAVLEAFRADRPVERLLIANGIEMGPQMREIITLAEAADIQIEHLDRRDLDRQSQTKKNQGVVAVLPDNRYVSVEDIILDADSKSQPPLIAVLDGIVDPHNLGAIARTMDAAGGHGIIIPERRAPGVSPGAIRASAGALMHLAVARVVNIPRTIDYLNQLGVQTLALAVDADTDYTDVDLKPPTAIVVGSEEKGVSRLAREKCAAAISIPMRGQLASLNASVSAAIAIYEAVKQRAND
ncbi:MAG: 23S rRNA (guanosine(2251)-2'-O)-methyltransferase RlmB [Chloroflexi bacterium]|nr:23S rRNA (guanosine(2251)-2'-O)-methyltransferase RlmB [Chloroflexota bacterium]